MIGGIPVATDGLLAVEQPHMAGSANCPCWPTLIADRHLVDLRCSDVDAPAGETVLWQHVGEEEDARRIYGWMTDRPNRWRLWARIARLFGGEILDILVVAAARTEAAHQAVAADKARADQAERLRLHEEIELFALNRKNRKPALSLESGDEHTGFFVMSLSERWERDRVMDWLRWQEDRYHEFRDLMESEGQVAVERLILAGMRETERDVRKRGLSSGGRRPLRFWRGE